jgi:hypothetical protein
VERRPRLAGGGHHGRDRGPSRFPIFGRSGFTRRSTRSDSSPISSTSRDVDLVADEASSSRPIARPRPGSASQAGASGWRSRSRRCRAASGPGRRAWRPSPSRLERRRRDAAQLAAGQRVRWTLSGARRRRS